MEPTIGRIPQVKVCSTALRLMASAIADAIRPKVKICAECKQSKPEQEFPSHWVRGRRYFASKCRSCINDQNMRKRRAQGVLPQDEYHKARRARPAIVPVAKICCKCKKSKSAEEFSTKSVNGRRYLASPCKSCLRDLSNQRNRAKGIPSREEYLRSRTAEYRLPDVKACSKCKAPKPATEFYKRRRAGRTYLSAACKACFKCGVYAAAKSRRCADPIEAERMRLWRAEHKRKQRRALGARPRSLVAEQAVARRAEREAERAKRRAIRAIAASQADAHVRRWRKMGRHRQYQRAYRATPRGRLDGRMKTAIRKALRGGKAGRRWEQLTGYSVAELEKHMERQFTKGMTLANMGRWHIDHITPRSAFSYSSPDDPAFKACWALSNLRPMWGADNLRKNAKRTHLL